MYSTPPAVSALISASRSACFGCDMAEATECTNYVRTRAQPILQGQLRRPKDQGAIDLAGRLEEHGIEVGESILCYRCERALATFRRSGLQNGVITSRDAHVLMIERGSSFRQPASRSGD